MSSIPVDAGVKVVKNSIFAVIVTFNPENDVLTRILGGVVRQVDNIIIVDNGSLNKNLIGIKELVSRLPQVLLISLTENMGIAHAQNCGIGMAFDMNASHILLLDHDSIPADDMVEKLVMLESELLSKGFNVGAVGPTSIDRRTSSHSGFVRKVGIMVKRIYPKNPPGFVETDFLIASGTLIRAEVLEAIGLMNAGYFIDHVDTEWCFRATSTGYKLFGSANAFLNHRLGDSVIRIWLGRWREIPKHSPLRNYYIFRNTIHMVTHVPMSFSWRLAHIYRLMIFLVFFLLAGKPRYGRFKMMVTGILDGIRGVSGKYRH